MAGFKQDPDGIMPNDGGDEATPITPLTDFTPDPTVDTNRSAEDRAKHLAEIHGMEGVKVNIEAEKTSLEASLDVNETQS